MEGRDGPTGRAKNLYAIKISSLQNDKKKKYTTNMYYINLEKICRYNLWKFLELMESFLRFFSSNTNPRASQLVLGSTTDSFKS